MSVFSLKQKKIRKTENLAKRKLETRGGNSARWVILATSKEVLSESEISWASAEVNSHLSPALWGSPQECPT